MIYNWQQKDWPKFVFKDDAISAKALEYIAKSGSINGMMTALTGVVAMDVVIASLLAEALKTSEIEGEFISREDVMSSLRNKLGLNAVPEKIKDRRASGVVNMMLCMRASFAEEMSQSQLFEWHRLLMEGNHYVRPGAWRISAEPMQVISGAAGREQVHFEAPPASKVPAEMEAFIAWFNQTAPGGKKAILYAPLRSAIAHLYFESIHPFEDGNGRIGRAISEKVLSQHAGYPVVLSLSQVIEENKKAYYKALKNAQRSNQIDEWILYFTGVILEAQHRAESQLIFVLKKTQFFDRYKELLNVRQLKVINKMLAHGPSVYEGGMSTSKYMGITKASKATATRDLQDLFEKGVISSEGEGRGRRYYVKL